MSIDLSNFRDKAVASIPVKGKLKKDNLDVNGRKINFIEPVKYEGEIYRVDRDKLLHLNVIYSYQEACGRCLESFTKKERAVLSGKLVEKTDKIEQDGEDEIIYYVDEKLDLAEYIISTIILSLPMKPLCHEECKGLCPKCGTNHNKEDCQCVIEDVDPRLAILKDLFPKK
ncbi:conserved hypothetical protein [[Clostridium] ultunense Esp]|uniref:DUF177 domain-containing protein n=1 Tax=[Clostridium] ultunense Esp TaxID=1288971 RepID=M1YSV4_9FIRM|nr:DUF177 domain-containing protein [Schnuerera ultunensis]CCQ93635.1 conserved hypothetical protein [[Clostridium] ultunense Esp]SHD76980.1 conserved protein of unknown function [[Clostridium] ultunense Esp]